MVDQKESASLQQSAASVLVVDDDEGLRRMFGVALKQIGCAVREAANGEQAYEMLLAGFFDLVVTDIQMPVMDGLALIEKIKENFPQMPIVVVTGQGPGIIATGAYGPATVLQKPFPLSALQGAVKIALNRPKGDLTNTKAAEKASRAVLSQP